MTAFTKPLSFFAALPFVAGAAIAFNLAYAFPPLNVLIVGYLFCLLQLARLPTARQAFYAGLAAGMLSAAPQLYFFWLIFGPAAIALWVIPGFWIGLFVALARLCLIRFGPEWMVALAAFLWTGLEYFRSELYYLRFSWVNVGYAFSGNLPPSFFHFIGVYGIGFVSMAIAAAISVLRPVRAAAAVAIVAAMWAGMLVFNKDVVHEPEPGKSPALAVAGVQLEFRPDYEIIAGLNGLARKFPEMKLFVLSEYTFDGPVPDAVKKWCRDQSRYLIVGGKDPAPKNNFFDTAFVIDPNGEIVFRQVKSVPIQFFKDGLPAPEQKLWDSPWGKIGICICYDLSYARVTDRLVKMGAQALIVPTMDVVDWGGHERRLHGLVAPVRAAEYGLPIFRVSSSGISQLVDDSGHVQASAGFPGQGDLISGNLDFSERGSVPYDRWLAPFCTAVTGALIIWFALNTVFKAQRAEPHYIASPKASPVAAE